MDTPNSSERIQPDLIVTRGITPEHSEWISYNPVTGETKASADPSLRFAFHSLVKHKGSDFEEHLGQKYIDGVTPPLQPRFEAYL
jgi:hypothetical protein